VYFALDPGAQLSGTLTDRLGNPARFVGVRVLDMQGNEVAHGTTYTTGYYLTYPGVPSGSYRVRFGTEVSPWYCDLPVYAAQYYANAAPLNLTAGVVTKNINAVVVPLAPKVYLPLRLRM
jgi:hypothetical protein